jgi:hypothetical protein
MAETTVDDHKVEVTTVTLVVNSLLHRIVEYLIRDPRFSANPQETRCDCKEPMRDKVNYFVGRVLRKTMGRRSTLAPEEQSRFCSDVERYIDARRQKHTAIADSGAVAFVCSQWKTRDGRDLPFDTAMRYYKDHKKRKREPGS